VIIGRPRRVLLPASVIHFLPDAFSETLYVYRPLWASEFGLSFSQVGLIRSAYTGGMSAFQIPAGFLAERKRLARELRAKGNGAAAAQIEQRRKPPASVWVVNQLYWHARDRFAAFLLKLVPPIGPLGALKFKMPTPDVEKLFMQSFERSTAQYRADIDVSKINNLHLENKNYDVGVVTPPGGYRLDDDTHAYWLNLLAKQNFDSVTPPIQNDLLSYYGDLNVALNTKKHPNDWKRLLIQLDSLKTRKDAATVSGQP